MQKSILDRLQKDKHADKFFKVFYERMREAQAEIKATVTVNTGEGLSAKPVEEGTTTIKDSGVSDKLKRSMLDISIKKCIETVYY